MEKKRFVRLKVSVRCAIVNRATAEIHMNNAVKSTIVVMHLVGQEHCAIITKEHSIVHAAMDTLVTHIMRAVAWHSNVRVMLIVHQVPNVFNRIVNQNVETCVKSLVADQIPNVRQLIMLVFVNACLDLVVKRLTQLSVADHCQLRAHYHQIVVPIRIVMVAFVNQLVF